MSCTHIFKISSNLGIEATQTEEATEMIIEKLPALTFVRKTPGFLEFRVNFLKDAEC